MPVSVFALLPLWVTTLPAQRPCFVLLNRTLLRRCFVHSLVKVPFSVLDYLKSRIWWFTWTRVTGFMWRAFVWPAVVALPVVCLQGSNLSVNERSCMLGVFTLTRASNSYWCRSKRRAKANWSASISTMLWHEESFTLPAAFFMLCCLSQENGASPFSDLYQKRRPVVLHFFRQLF